MDEISIESDGWFSNCLSVVINTPAPTSKTDLEPDPTLIVSVSLIAAALTPPSAVAETISDTFFMLYILLGETLWTFGGEYDLVFVIAAGG